MEGRQIAANYPLSKATDTLQSAPCEVRPPRWPVEFLHTGCLGHLVLHSTGIPQPSTLSFVFSCKSLSLLPVNRWSGGKGSSTPEMSPMSCKSMTDCRLEDAAVGVQREEQGGGGILLWWERVRQEVCDPLSGVVGHVQMGTLVLQQ